MKLLLMLAAATPLLVLVVIGYGPLDLLGLSAICLFWGGFVLPIVWPALWKTSGAKQ